MHRTVSRLRAVDLGIIHTMQGVQTTIQLVRYQFSSYCMKLQFLFENVYQTVAVLQVIALGFVILLLLLLLLS